MKFTIDLFVTFFCPLITQKRGFGVSSSSIWKQNELVLLLLEYFQAGIGVKLNPVLDDLIKQIHDVMLLQTLHEEIRVEYLFLLLVGVYRGSSFK